MKPHHANASTLTLRGAVLALCATTVALPPPALAQAAEAAASSPAAAATAPPLETPAEIRPVTLGDDGLDIENEERLKGLKKVALAGLALYVVTESSGAATSGVAFRDRSMAYVNSSLKVTGLDPATLQALADHAWDRTAQALKARGIEVVPLAELKALPALAELAAATESKAPMPLDASAGKGTIFSAHGLPLVHQSELSFLSRTVGGMFGAKVEDRYVGMGENMSAAFRKPKLDAAFDAISAATGAPVVLARVVLSAAQVKASGGAFSLTASTSVRDSLVMPTWTNRLWVRQPGGNSGRVSLKYPLVSETPPGKIVDVTSTAAKVADVATTVLTFAAAMSGVGRGVVQSTTELELRTTPQWFDAVARPQIGTAVEGLVKGLAP